jgi:hypothetical protein
MMGESQAAYALPGGAEESPPAAVATAAAVVEPAAAAAGSVRAAVLPLPSIVEEGDRAGTTTTTTTTTTAAAAAAAAAVMPPSAESLSRRLRYDPPPPSALPSHPTDRPATRPKLERDEQEEEPSQWLVAVAELQPSTQPDAGTRHEQPAAAARRRAVDALSPYAWQVVPQYSGSPREVKRKCGVCGEPKFGTHGPSGCPLVGGLHSLLPQPHWPAPPRRPPIRASQLPLLRNSWHRWLTSACVTHPLLLPPAQVCNACRQRPCVCVAGPTLCPKRDARAAAACAAAALQTPHVSGALSPRGGGDGSSRDNHRVERSPPYSAVAPKSPRVARSHSGSSGSSRSAVTPPWDGRVRLPSPVPLTGLLDVS